MWSGPIGRAFIFCLSAGLYMGSMHGDFVMDDSVAIVNNKVVTGEEPASMVWSTNFWGDELGSPNARHHSWRPIVTAVFRLEYWFAGPDNTTPFHIVNMLLYGLCSVLFQIACERVFLGTPAKVVQGGSCSNAAPTPDVAFESFAAAAVFAAHPIHVDAVASLVGRCEIMAAIVVLVALLSCASGGPVWLHVALGYLATLSKEPAAAVFAVFLVHDYFVLNRYDYSGSGPAVAPIKGNKKGKRGGTGGGGRYLWMRGALTTMFGIVCVLQRVAMNKGDDVMFDAQTNPASHAKSDISRVLTQLHYCVLHFWKLVWPATLSFDYSGPCIPLVKGLSDPRNGGLALLGAILAALAWYCISPLLLDMKARTTPVDDNMSVPTKKASKKGGKKNENENETEANQKDSTPVDPEGVWGSIEHRARVGVACAMTVAPFLPASGFFMWIGFVLAERIMFMPTIGFCVLLLLLLRPTLRGGGAPRALVQTMLLTIVAVASWRTVLRNPAWNNAESLYETALEVYPMNAKAHHNLAHKWFTAKERHAEVEFHMKEAIRVHPEYGTAYINLGVHLAQQGRQAEACDLWKNAVTTYDDWSSKVMGELPTLARNYAMCTKNLGRTEDRAWLKKRYPNLIQD